MSNANDTGGLVVYEVLSQMDRYSAPVSLGLYLEYEDAKERQRQEQATYPNDDTYVTARRVK